MNSRNEKVVYVPAPEDSGWRLCVINSEKDEPVNNRNEKVVYVLAPEDSGWRLCVINSEEAGTNYDCVGPLAAVLSSLTLAAERFDRNFPAANGMVGAYTVVGTMGDRWTPLEVMARLRGVVTTRKSDPTVIKGQADEIERLRSLNDDLSGLNANLKDRAARLEEEVELVVEQHNALSAQLERQTTEVERLRDENERLKTDNARFQAGLYEEWTCSYCRAQFDTEDALKDHDLECKDNPVAHFKAEIDRLAADNAMLAAKLGEARRMNRLYEETYARRAERRRRLGPIRRLFVSIFGP